MHKLKGQALQLFNDYRSKVDSSDQSQLDLLAIYCDTQADYWTACETIEDPASHLRAKQIAYGVKKQATAQLIKLLDKLKLNVVNVAEQLVKR